MFLATVDRCGDDECWPWLGSTREGYGVISDMGIKRQASHVSHELFIGPIQRGLQVLHKCDNPICVNPKHLEAGTQSKNMKDCYARGRSKLPLLDTRGEKNGFAKLTFAQASEIRRLVLLGANQTSVAKRFKISNKTVNHIKTGYKWKCLGETLTRGEVESRLEELLALECKTN